MIETLFKDFIWIALAVAILYRSVIAMRDPLVRQTFFHVVKRKIHKVSLVIILIFVTLGWLDQIKIPDSKSIADKSLIDYAFFWNVQERTYSSPFASSVTGIPQEGESKDSLKVSGIHILGTDINGYDVLQMTMKGAGTALILSLLTTLIALPVGVILGMLAGYYGGIIDDVIQWAYTTVASIPWLLFVIAFLMVYGRGLFWVALAMGLTSWVGLARLIRGETLKLKELDYITAAKSQGIPAVSILFRHMLPNLRYLIIITFVLSASNVILAESILTFIGLGVEPGTASWGRMLVEAQKELVRSPPVWWIFFAASFVGILPLVLSLNLLGDSLRDALDPRIKGKG